MAIPQTTPFDSAAGGPLIKSANLNHKWNAGAPATSFQSTAAINRSVVSTAPVRVGCFLALTTEPRDRDWGASVPCKHTAL